MVRYFWPAAVLDRRPLAPPPTTTTSGGSKQRWQRDGGLSISFRLFNGRKPETLFIATFTRASVEWRQAASTVTAIFRAFFFPPVWSATVDAAPSNQSHARPLHARRRTHVSTYKRSSCIGRLSFTCLTLARIHLLHILHNYCEPMAGRAAPWPSIWYLSLLCIGREGQGAEIMSHHRRRTLQDAAEDCNGRALACTSSLDRTVSEAGRPVSGRGATNQRSLATGTPPGSGER